MGNDLLVFYYGNSDKMEMLKKGKITDTDFINKVISTAKEHAKDTSFQIKIKPTSSDGVGKNFKEFVDVLNTNDLQNRSIDTLDEHEKIKFKTTSLEGIISRVHEKPPPTQLPADDSSYTKKGHSPEHAMVVLVFGDKGIYAYMGTDITSGKMYNYENFKQYLLTKKAAGSLVVLIKSSSKTTYKNIVDMLDQMTTNEIEKYSLVDITEMEEDYIRKLAER